ALTSMAGTLPDSPGHGLDTGRIPVSKENWRVWGGLQAWSLNRRLAGLVRLDPRPVFRTSRQAIPVLLDSSPLASARDERSPGARRRSQPTDSSQGRREQLAVPPPPPAGTSPTGPDAAPSRRS